MATQPYLQKYLMDYISGSESFVILVAIDTLRCSPRDSHFANDASKIYIGFHFVLLSCITTNM